MVLTRHCVVFIPATNHHTAQREQSHAQGTPMQGFCFVGLAQHVRWPSKAVDKRLATHDGLGSCLHGTTPYEFVVGNRVNCAGSWGSGRG